MKRRTEHLVEKRDGRTEWLRTTKLARSVHQALCSVGVNEDWRALEVANAVVHGVRARRDAAVALGRNVGLLSTAELADAVQNVLVATGHPAAAAAYGSMAVERQRRRNSLATLGRSIHNEGPAFLGAAMSLHGEGMVATNRLPKE